MATLFSTLLTNHITNKNIKTPLLAQYCNMDRSNMYKLLKGKRNPASEDTVHKISDYIRLTPLERRELLEAYKITLIGPDTFYRRRDVQEFIQYFTEKLPEFPSIYTDFSSTLFRLNTLFRYSSQESIRSILPSNVFFLLKRKKVQDI